MNAKTRHEQYVAANLEEALNELTLEESESLRVEILIRSPAWAADAFQEPEDYPDIDDLAPTQLENLR